MRILEEVIYLILSAPVRWDVSSFHLVGWMRNLHAHSYTEQHGALILIHFIRIIVVAVFYGIRRKVGFCQHGSTVAQGPQLEGDLL